MMLLLLLFVVSVVSASDHESKAKLQDPASHDVISEGVMFIGNGRIKRFIAMKPEQALNRTKPVPQTKTGQTRITQQTRVAQQSRPGQQARPAQPARPQLAKPNQQQKLQACVLPDGRNGFCRPLRHCIQDEFQNDFVKFLDYMCVFNNTMGACCPDNAKRGGIEGLAGDLPAIAPQEDKNDAANKISKAKNRGCGLTTRSQIVNQGGRVAKPREWPWMVSVTPKGAKIHCGGTLITERHVITAAHCVDKHKPKDLVARLGEYDFQRNDDTRSYNFKIVEIRIHERYQTANRWNDIAILKLDRPCKFNTYVWPICLPSPNLRLINQNTTLIGWGTQAFGGKTSNVLQEVLMPVWNLTECIEAHVDTVFQENLCAGSREGGKDACQFDSGGPLMYQNAAGRWMLVGVVSWGLRCGEPNHPGIYTRVDKYIPWIQRNTGV